MVDFSIDAARSVSDGVVLVVSADAADDVEPAVDAVVVGGATRSESVRAGLAAVPDDAQVVLVHDAARPVAGHGVFRAVVDAVLAGADAAVPVVPVTDSLRTVEGRPVDRSGLVAVQTPQGFQVDVLRSAHGEGDTATDDASLVDRLGFTVVHVEGDPTNMKITAPHDLRLAEVLLHDR